MRSLVVVTCVAWALTGARVVLAETGGDELAKAKPERIECEVHLGAARHRGPCTLREGDDARGRWTYLITAAGKSYRFTMTDQEHGADLISLRGRHAQPAGRWRDGPASGDYFELNRENGLFAWPSPDQWVEWWRPGARAKS